VPVNVANRRAGGERPGRVPRVVRSGEPQRDRHRGFERPGEKKRHAVSTLHELDQAIRGFIGRAVGGDGPARRVASGLRREACRAAIIGTGHE